MPRPRTHGRAATGDRGPGKAIAAAGLIVLVVTGCADGGDHPITPGDQAAVSRAMSALTPPTGYRRSATCSVAEAWCFTSDEPLSGPAQASFRTLLQQFGIVVPGSGVHCDSTGTLEQSSSLCEALGRIGDVELSVTLVSTRSENQSMPRGTRVVIGPARITM